MTRSLSAREVQEATGINKKRITDWESGQSKPFAHDLVLLADFYQVSMDYLTGRSEHELGLDPGLWVLDMDIVENGTSDPEERWCFKVPRKYRIASYEDMRRIERGE